MINKKRLIRNFMDLVRIDSPSKQEAAVVKRVKADLKKLGLKPVEDNAGKKFGGSAGNVFATLNGTVPGAPVIFLNAHLDTVSPGRGIKPRRRGGYIESDGTTILGADNKAGVAIILEVLRFIRENDVPRGDIKAVFTVSEEIGLYGAKYMRRKAISADFGLTLDGGEIDEIINRAPSQDNISARIRGRAAHAGVHPEDGINAIKVASHAVSSMKLGRIDPETTANIGIIKGGVATNIIPDLVKLKGEARSHSIKKLARQVDHMKRKFSSACKKFGARLEMKRTSAYRSFFVSGRDPLLKLAVKSARLAGIKPRVVATGGGSDANIFNAMGIPTIIIGTGADRVHTTKERVSVRQMVQSVRFVIEIIREASNA